MSTLQVVQARQPDEGKQVPNSPQPGEPCLNQASGDSLRNLLTNLSDVHNYKYSFLSRNLKLKAGYIYAVTNRRSNGHESFKKLLIKFCEEKGIEWISFFSNDYGDLHSASRENGIYIRLPLDLEDVRNSIKHQAGCYLMYTLVEKEQINVTWYDFMNHAEPSSLPKFSAWRRNKDGSIKEFSGEYCITQNSLSLIGIGDRTFRISTLVLDYSAPNHKDRYGYTSGYSEVDELIAVPCYMEKLPFNADKQDYMGVIGERNLSEGRTLFPNVEEMLQKLRNIPFNIKRLASI